jgi:hypothetical protein
MKKLIGLLVGLGFCAGAAAQMTTVTATSITDSDGTLWANGTVAVQFVPNPAQPNPGAYKICSSGALLNPTLLNQAPVTLAGAAGFSVTTYDNSQVCPQGSQWQFTVCPNASSKCGIITLPVSGTTQSITTQVNTGIPAPRFAAIANNFGYADVEAQLQLVPGGLYYNVTDLCYRQFSGATFSCLGAGNPFTIPIPINQGGSAATTAAGAFTNIVAPSGLFQGIPQANLFTGADICAKINTAALFALANGINQVDATHFSGIQPCATNMLNGLCTASAVNCNLVINLGAVHIQSSVAQSITNTGISLHGMSPMQTQLEYIGATLIPAVLQMGDTAHGENNNQIEKIFIYGDNSNATDGVLLQAVFHSQFRDVWTWGVTGCGIHDEAGVTNTFDAPRTSSFDAAALGITSGHSQPTSAFCLDQNTTGAFTGVSSNDLLLNPAAEGVSGAGFNMLHGINTTITGGSSEDNQIGVSLSSSVSVITLIDMDLESNTVNDILENGHFDLFLNDSLGSSTGKDLEIGPNSAFAMEIGGAITSSVVDNPSAAAATLSSGGSWSFPQLLSTTLSGNFAISGTLNAGATTLSGLTISNNLGVVGQIGNNNAVLFPSTTTGFVGSSAGGPALVLTGTTANIIGTALSASCDSGTATVTGATIGNPVIVSSTTGVDVGGAFNIRASVTATNTVTVFVCGTGTPNTMSYNVIVF